MITTQHPHLRFITVGDSTQNQVPGT